MSKKQQSTQSVSIDDHRLDSAIGKLKRKQSMNEQTKSDIIQRLLDEKQITVKEAMVLMGGEKEYIPYQPSNIPNYIPSHPSPTLPQQPPYYPDWTWRPGTITYSYGTNSTDIKS